LNPVSAPSAKAPASETLVPGALYVVATPIGNLSDLSPRARDVLAGVSIIAAEDTRHTATLLQAFGIGTPLLSLHEHNERDRAPDLVGRLKAGDTVALVSDAGTPLVSDPGFELVRIAVAAGIRVIPLPGASAVVAALCASGLPVDRFAFEGFLPSKPTARREALAALSRESRTLVFYEAPHRLQDVLADMAAALGPTRRGSIARELTKHFETMYYGTLEELAQRSRSDKDMVRGELVLVVAGANPAEGTLLAVKSEQVLRTLLEELPAAQAAKLAARLTGEKRGDLYDLAVRLQEKRQDP